MELTEAQYERIAPHLPVRRGNVSLSNRQVLNAILYVAEHLQREQIVRIKLEAGSMDGALVVVRPNGTGAPK